MKFKQFLLTEDKSFNDVIRLIEKNCQPYVKDFIKADQPTQFFYRGYEGKVNDIVMKTVRKNRKPLDTPIELHNALNKAFKKKFGVNLRSESLFVTNNNNIALDYGPIYMVFPIGKYSIYWSEKIRDLYVYFNDNHNLIQWLKHTEKVNKEAELAVKTYVKGNLKKKLNDGKVYSNEVMLLCDKYYLVNFKYREQLINYFKNRS